jgi:hypothetical protein
MYRIITSLKIKDGKVAAKIKRKYYASLRRRLEINHPNLWEMFISRRLPRRTENLTPC